MGDCCHDNSNVTSMAEMLRWRVRSVSYAGAARRGKVIQIMESISCDFWSRELTEGKKNKGIKWGCAKHQPLVTDGYLTSDSCFASKMGTKTHKCLLPFYCLLGAQHKGLHIIFGCCLKMEGKQAPMTTWYSSGIWLEVKEVGAFTPNSGSRAIRTKIKIWKAAIMFPV